MIYFSFLDPILAYATSGPKKNVGGKATGFEITFEPELLPQKEITNPTKGKPNQPKGKNQIPSKRTFFRSVTHRLDVPTKGKKGTGKNPKQSGKKNKQKISDEDQKVLDDWDKFERDLERRRKQEAREARRQTRSGSVSTLPVVKQEEEETRTKRTLSVSAATELAAQKTKDRKTRKEQVNEHLRQIGEKEKEEKEEVASESTEGSGRTRGWKVRMDSMRGKGRQDYVSMYKSLAQRTQEEAAKKESQETPTTPVKVPSQASQWETKALYFSVLK